jgi:regulator of replication initiation timing
MLKANTLKLFLNQNHHLLSDALSLLRSNRDLNTIRDTHIQALTTHSLAKRKALQAIAQQKKYQFVKRLMNNGFDLTCQAFYCMKRYNKVMVRVDKRGVKVRVRSLKRILDGWVRGMGKGLKVLRKWC